jgi:hypothetical protein
MDYFYRYPDSYPHFTDPHNFHDPVVAAEAWFEENKKSIPGKTLLVSHGNIFQTTPRGFALAKVCERPTGPTGPTGPAGPNK